MNTERQSHRTDRLKHPKTPFRRPGQTSPRNRPTRGYSQVVPLLDEEARPALLQRAVGTALQDLTPSADAASAPARGRLACGGVGRGLGVLPVFGCGTQVSDWSRKLAEVGRVWM